MVELEEDGIKFLADLENGQKTGFFLDQKENRRSLRYISKDAEVLDCFCYTGSFSLFAAKYGAKTVTGIDASEAAVQHAARNAALNGFDKTCNFVSGNAFDLLPAWAKEKRLFDIVILDPPAFTKNRAVLNLLPGVIRKSTFVR
jgi:23S rRNA (cytosine1962-C5)-methyltransferase